MQAITLTLPPHSVHVSISMSPKAPTFGEHPFQALCPGHRGAALGKGLRFIQYLDLVPFATFRWRYQGAVLTIRRKHTVKSRQIHARLRHQGGQSCDEIQRLEDHMSERRPVVPSRYGVLSW